MIRLEDRDAALEENEGVCMQGRLHCVPLTNFGQAWMCIGAEKTPLRRPKVLYFESVPEALEGTSWTQRCSRKSCWPPEAYGISITKYVEIIVMA